MKDNLISELSGRYGDDKTDKLVRYMQRILDINEHINLTAVREEGEFLELVTIMRNFREPSLLLIWVLAVDFLAFRLL